MDIRTAFALESDPEFIALPYEEQIKARIELIRQAIVDNPDGFFELPPEEQTRAFAELTVKRAPKFQKPSMQALADRFTEVYNTPDDSYQSMDLGLIPGPEGKGAREKAIGDMMNLIGMYRLGSSDHMGLYRLALKAVQWGADQLPGDFMDIEEAVLGPDMEKMVGHLESLLENGGEWDRTRTGIVKALAGISGLVIGTGSTYALTGAGNFTRMIKHGAEAYGVAKFGGATGVGSRVLRWAVEAVAGGNIPEAIGAGFHQSMLEAARMVADDEVPEDQLVMMGNLGKAFAEGAIGDFAWNFGVGTLGRLAGQFGRVLTGAGITVPISDIAKMMPDDYAKMVDEYVSGRMRPEHLALLPEQIRDHMRFVRDYRQAAVTGAEFIKDDPFARSVIVGGNSGLFVTNMDDGTFHIRKALDPRQAETIVGVRNLATRVSEELQSQAKNIKDLAERAKFVQEYQNAMLNMVSEGRIDKVLDPDLKLDPMSDAFKKIMAERRARHFLSPATRGAISNTEAMDIVRAGNEAPLPNKRVFTMDLPTDAKTIDELGKNIPLFKTLEQGAGMKVARSQQAGNALVVIENLADPDTYRSALREVEIMKAQGAIGEVGDLLALKLIDRGYDAFEDAAGELTHLFPSKIRFISEQVSPKTGRLVAAAAKAKVSGDFSELATRASVQRILEHEVPASGVRETATDVIVKAFADATGTMDEAKLTNVLKAYVGRMGRNVQGLSVVADDIADGIPFMSGSTMHVPRRISTLEEQQKLIRGFFDEANKYAEQTAGMMAGAHKGWVFEDMLGEMTNKFVPPEGIDRVEWFRGLMVAGDLPYIGVAADGSYMRALPQMGTQRFSSLDELMDTVLKEQISESFLRADLQEHGLSLVKHKRGGFEIKGPGDVTMGVGRDIPSLLDDANYRPKRLPHTLGPRAAILEDGASRLSTDGNIVRGSRKHLLEYLDKFTDADAIKAEKKTFRTVDGVVLKPNDYSWRVRIPEASIIEEFSDASAARRFLKLWNQDPKVIGELALKRGFTSIRDGGNWIFSGADGNFIVRNGDELKTFLKAYPDPEWAPDLIEVPFTVTAGMRLPPEWSAGIPPASTDAPMKAFRQAAVKLFKNQVEGIRGAFTLMGAFWKPLPDYIRTAAKTFNAPDLDTYFHKVLDTNDIYRVELQRGQKIISQMWQVPDKDGVMKTMELGRRRALYEIYTTKDDDLRDLLLEQFLPSQAELRVLDRWREFFGKDAHSGMFFRLGFDPKTWEDNYMSRIRRFASDAKNKEIINDMLKPEDLFKRIGYDKIPEDIDWWARHRRVTDLIDEAMERDPLELGNLYLRRGLLQYYMKDSWTDLIEYVNKTPEIPSGVLDRLTRYMDMLTGKFDDPATRLIEKAALQYAEKNGLDPRTAKNMLNFFYSTTYMTTMGWRPWLPLRNMFQIYQTGTRYSNVAINRGLRDLDQGKVSMRELQELGIELTTPPIVEEMVGRRTIGAGEAIKGMAQDLGARFTGNEAGRVHGIWADTHRSLVSSSLKWFKNSDGFTRAWAYRVAINEWDDAFEKLAKGIYRGPEDAMKAAGVEFLSPGQIQRISDLIKRGEMPAARFAYAKDVSFDTMYRYQRELSPTAFHSLLGRAFGQFGTYPTNYIQGILKQLGRIKDHPAESAVILARLAVNSAALYYVFKALDIDSRNFLPWMPMQFTGGPAYELIQNAIGSMDSGYKGRHSRGELLSQLPQYVIPGNYQVRYAIKMLEQLEEGNRWRAFLSFTSTPYFPE